MRAIAGWAVAVFGIFCVVLWRYAPPAARGVEEAEERFSAGRALAVERVIADGTPRSLGSEANAKARAFLQGELSRLGWKAERQEAMACTRHGACANVVNVIATREGRDPDAGAVLVMAHYDSVSCSPGAGDDGFGAAAVIEIGRAIAASPPLRRTVIAVLTDGEEAGLLGAEAFVREHPLARTVRGAVNIDARGSSGPSSMFETSTGNAWIVGLYAQNTDRPVSSSLFYEIYRRMPNDTDFTLVKDLAHGVNFANIRRVEHYHTPLDSLENADSGTLQHHGDQALAMVRALANAGPEIDAPRSATNDAVWFDVLACFVVRFPSRLALPMAIAALLLVAGWSFRMRAFGLGLAAPAAATAAALLASFLVGGALRALGALPVPWIAHPLPALIALHGACMLAGLALARVVSGRSSAPQTQWAGTWLMWGSIGVALAVAVPGASYLFVVPTLAAGALGWLPKRVASDGPRHFDPIRMEIASVIPAVVAAVLWLPLVVLVYDGLGVSVPAVTCIASTILVSTAPAVWRAQARRARPRPEIEQGGRKAGRLEGWTGGGAVGAIVVAVLIAVIVPKFSASAPQRVNVVFRQDEVDAGSEAPPARVYLEAAWGPVLWGRPPEGMRSALGDPARVRTESPTPWSSAVPVTDVPRVVLPAPEMIAKSTMTPAGGKIVRAHLRSVRGASTLSLVLPTSPRVQVLVQGHMATPRFGAIRLRAIPVDGVDIEIRAEENVPFDLEILDVTTGLPSKDAAAVARAVLDARPREAVQTQDGDVTIASRRIRL